jgi:hypothetical protein
LKAISEYWESISRRHGKIKRKKERCHESFPQNKYKISINHYHHHNILKRNKLSAKSIKNLIFFVRFHSRGEKFFFVEIKIDWIAVIRLQDFFENY